MRPHLVLRFTLGLLAGTSAAIVLPRAGNRLLQERTTIYFPGPSPGHSDTRAVHDDVQVPAELHVASRSLSDVTTTELLVSEEDPGDMNSMNTPKDASKRAPLAATAPQSEEQKQALKELMTSIFVKVGVGLAVLVGVFCLGVGIYKCHKKGHKKEMDRMRKGIPEKKPWYGKSKYRDRRRTIHG
ncbi:hypothetical protein QBC32DRAFT_211955 [Pseudoneurospora amorphoporcata]|uniref:Mid2 domain-containing protein n=1 Tax=Pseudoneurospora amorphoporcata TaxID=241081 RepID=A0AAN6SGZ3_9PEZI|nr:hypothetical protein QBC32DRAFT_211955 [Pseudoneurospora amorphoporcata]